jgi:HSP20 family protein
MTLIKRQESLLPSVWNNLLESTLFTHPLNGHSEFTIQPVNLSEDKDNFYIELAAPGMEKEHFSLQLDKQVLTVKAEKKTENIEENEDKSYSKKEFGYSSFTRSFTLPTSANFDKIDAAYDKGVLNVKIAKKDEAKETGVKQIDVK